MDPQLALMLLQVFVGMSADAALRRLGELLAQNHDLIQRVIRVTCRQFPEIEGAEASLHTWVASEAFVHFFERAYEGERDFDDEIVLSFMEDGAFYMADEEERSSIAQTIVALFLAELSDGIYRSDEGTIALANRQEVLHGETRSAIAGLEAKLQPLLTAAVSQAESRESLEPAFQELSAKIDLARDLGERGLVSSARTALMQLSDEYETIPQDLRFRLLTNLGSYALAEGDTAAACDYLDRAYQLRPSDQKAITNAAVGAHLQGDSNRAVKLAIEARNLDPQSSQATAVLLRELWDKGHTDQFEDLVSTEEWVSRDHACVLVLARVRIEQSRQKDALRLYRLLAESDPNDAVAHLALSQCCLSLADSIHRLQIGRDGESLPRLREAEVEASRAIDLLASTEFKARYQEAVLTRAGARVFLGSTTEAISDLDEVLGQDPTHPVAVFNKALLLLNQGQPQEARNLLQSIPQSRQSADAVQLLAEACFEAGDSAAAVSLLRDTLALDDPDWKEIRKAEVLSRAEVELGTEDSVEPILKNAQNRNPNAPRLLTLAAIRGELRDDPEGAEALLLEALLYAGKSDRAEVLIQLGTLFQRQCRFQEAAERLAEALNGSVSHPAAIALLISLVNGDQRRNALEWARAIRDSYRQPPKLAMEIEAQILEYAGDMPASVSCRREICSRTDATAVDQVKLAAVQFRCGERDTALATVSGICASQISDDPRSILQLAQLKSLLGLDDYLDDAYLARRYGMDDPNAHLGYFGIFLGREKQGWTEPDTVALGCAVLLKDDSHEQWWQLVEPGEQPRSRFEIAPNNDLARRLLGRHVGDIVVIRQDLEELSYEIRAIQSKYVRAYQETLNEFSTRFPGNMGLSRVKIEDDDITKILLTVDQRYKFAREVERLYRQKQLPFASFASILGRSLLEAWHACTVGKVNYVNFGFGTDDETETSSKTLRTTSCLCLDLTALLTVRELGLVEYLQRRFQTVAVPQHVIDELQETHANTVMGPISGHMGKAEDGRYTFTELTDAEWIEWQETVSSVLEFAESFERTPSYRILEAEDVEQLADVLTWAGVGAVYAAEDDTNCQSVLVSDDLGLAAIARSLGRNAVNTQAIVKELRHSQVITDKQYSVWIERMVMLNYRFVRLDPEDIVRRLEANGYITTDGTRSMIKTLEGPDCSEESAVSVGAGVIQEIAGRATARQTGLILSTILATLSQGREKSNVLQKFKREIMLRFDLVPYRRDQILGTVDTYMNLP